jgi:hypothetical protein
MGQRRSGTRNLKHGKKMKKKAALTIILSAFALLTYGQMDKDIFPLNREFKRGGLYIAPHATYTLGNNNEDTYTNLDTTYNYSVDGSGKIGYGLEVGWFHSFKRARLVHYLEAGVAYRVFKGAAEHQGELSTLNGQQQFESENEFNNQYIVASFRATNATQLGKMTYLNTSLGLNYNYLLADDYERSAPDPPFEEEFQADQSLQLHLQIGIGMRLSRMLIAIPYIESPLLTAIPQGNIKPSFTYFSTDYQPFIIGIKFLLLREDPMNCNAPTFDGPQPGM